MNKYYFFIVLLFYSVNLHSQSGKSLDNRYNISLSVKGLSESNVILGHYLGESMYPDDTVKLNQNGQGTFSGSNTLTQGLYVMYFENGSFFEVMVGQDQQFTLSTDTIDYVKNLQASGSLDNELFIEFQLYMLSKQNEMKDLQQKISTTENEAEKEKIKNKIIKLGNQRITRIHEIRNEYPELFVSTFLTATLDIEIPEELKDDSKLRYQYYKAHYFDYFDLADVRLLHTPLYEKKMLNYLDKVVLQIPDSLILEIDIILDKSLSDSSLYRYVLITLFNKYGKSKYMGMDAVQVHIAEKYYIPTSWWSDDKFISDLEERVVKLKPLLIGKVAPNVQLRRVPASHFKLAANDTALKKYPHAGSFFNILDVDAEFTVLLFWEAACSHCKKAVPDLYKVYEDTLKSMNVEVVSISTLFGEDGKEKWVDFVNDKGIYSWINAWNPYDYKYKEIYDVRTTPQIFVLNKDKEIIGKKLGSENVLDLIIAYKKHNK